MRDQPKKEADLVVRVTFILLVLMTSRKAHDAKMAKNGASGWLNDGNMASVVKSGVVPGLDRSGPHFWPFLRRAPSGHVR
jgi:hypothetical protein